MADVLSHFTEVKEYSGYWWATCPAHNDSRPSLKIRQDKSGIWRFDCKAGCTRKEIIEAAGLKEVECGKPFTVEKRRNSHKTFFFEDDHIYIDENKQPYMKVDRLRASDGDKTMTLYHWNLEQTSWKPGFQGERIPYHLPQVLDAISKGETILIAEGESCCDALARVGFIATTNSEGAGNWKETHTRWLKGARDIVILPDADPNGYKHLNLVAQALLSVGIPSVRWVKLRGVSPKGDIVDWFNKGGTPDELKALLAKAVQWKGPVEFREEAPLPKTKNVFDLLQEEIPDPVWVVPGLIPAGLTLLGGKPKHGKSWLALGLCVDLALGAKVLNYKEAKQIGVLYLALEDIERRLKDRFSKVIGAVKNARQAKTLECVTQWPRLDEGGADLLDEWLCDHSDVRFVVVDTLKQIRGRQKSRDSFYDQDYDAINALKQVADKHDIALMVVHHLRKAPSEDDPFDELSGSTGLSGASDTITILKREQGKDGAATLYVRGRDVEEQKLVLAWDESVYGWSVLGPAEENPQGKTDQQNQILAVLKAASPKSLLPKEIQELTGLNASYIKLALNRLHHQGKIHSMGIGKGWIIKHGSSYKGDNPDNYVNLDYLDNCDNLTVPIEEERLSEQLSLATIDNPSDNYHNPSHNGQNDVTIATELSGLSVTNNSCLSEQLGAIEELEKQHRLAREQAIVLEQTAVSYEAESTEVTI